MKHIFYSLIVTGLITACSPQSQIKSGGDTQTHAQNAAGNEASGNVIGLTLTEGVLQPPFPGRDVSAGFFTLTNTGSADRLLSARSTVSETVEIHTHIEEDGIMKMRRVDGVDVPAGTVIEFKPGGYHLMMFNSVIPDDAYFANITLEFETSGEKTFTVPIDGRDAPSYGSDHTEH